MSKHYYNLYDKDFQERRKKYKPELVPPFYVDYPKTLEEIVKSEIKYLDAYDIHPLITDIRYFFNAMYNIFLNDIAVVKSKIFGSSNEKLFNNLMV